jgi:hypothetical protein
VLDGLCADRIAIDETSLAFRCPPEAIRDRLDQLSNALDELRAAGHTVWFHPDAYDSVECLEGVSLLDFLFSRPAHSAPDALRRLVIQLDRCRIWAEDEPGFVSEILRDGKEPELGFSVGIAVARASSGRLMACLTTSDEPAGFQPVHSDEHRSDVYFFPDFPALSGFWRGLYPRERLPEKEFFSLVDHAFPGLILHPGLSFRSFAGSYEALRDEVVRILAALNDHFPGAMLAGKGIPDEVSAQMGRFGVDLSPESSSTRSSSKLMGKRDVELDGRIIRCEWHAKIERHRNRIHFSLPDQALDGRIVIGIFVEHLDT